MLSIQNQPVACLLSWLGISVKLPCKKPACTLTKELDNIGGTLNIGTFLFVRVKGLSLYQGSSKLKSKAKDQFIFIKKLLYKAITRLSFGVPMTA